MKRKISNFKGCKALVVGLGDTGAACVRWLIEHDAQVRATDTREEPPHAQHVREAFPEASLRLGGFEREDFEWADLVVVSPGVALATPELQWAVKAGKDVVGDVELFARALKDTSAYVIAITGSNGKSTVTSLVGHLCAAVGLDTVVAGNIGLPVLDALDNQDTLGRCPDVWVLELSSFQLETTSSLKPDAATVLNISQDHMDRYANLDDYAVAKTRIFAGQGVQVLNRDDPAVMAMALEDRTQWTFGLTVNEALAPGQFGLATRKDRLWLCEGDEALLPVDKLPIAGLHNAANALAALALCRAIQLPYEGLIPALKTFEGLPHRVQKVAEVAGRTFYDDSKGTNVGATAAALLGFASPVVLIAGGDGKGQDFSPLRAAVGNARAVVQIGRDGPLIEAAIGGACPVHRAESMEEAVQLAFKLSRAGDAVLLSPACASWDMFRNYAHRAEVFIAAVKQLEAGGVS
ncbi:MAG TPA: UDP-N-acetylmuramoyl-L-alanine--D-glutamate ligase [Thiobacillaceae bacterium]|nr:UDP-N-acetylmuramoyl-L-alanine--D-glutamate ligase [Thiobacillaceae bacterium]HNA82767.1 UDP-N-acetylmuramoyl-L-alanine--D-glutamate ligase [Thiobacillaceae bacterium]HNH87877.1 UDP-N-acetylmuramoyl-L-alanine--D-glutamate ligase [Thiobacillaceae bacterium]HNI08979.1 UDP-N-acetylmuramoyl-L-alanine--D-glutamate ligase [Thiobacillaceae bacterium]